MTPTTIIFICTFDPFGESLARYEFRNICEQYPYLELHDGTHKVFINATSTQNDLGDEMKALLDYIIGFELFKVKIGLWSRDSNGKQCRN